MTENRKKHALVEELNDYVGGSVGEMVDDERKYFENEERDKLKVPPYSKVKRRPRDYENEHKIVLEYKQRELDSKTQSANTFNNSPGMSHM